MNKLWAPCQYVAANAKSSSLSEKTSEIYLRASEKTVGESLTGLLACVA